MRRLQAIGCLCVLCCVLWVAVATPAQGQQASDIQVGRRVEVQPDRKDAAQVEWIKVDTGAAPS